tara:strand:- start:113 stop:379 length:267 start_codon:yes stop_codon:yes gene_type:complete
LFRPAARAARLAKLPLETCPPLFLAVALWIRAAADLLIGVFPADFDVDLVDIFSSPVRAATECRGDRCVFSQEGVVRRQLGWQKFFQK